MIAYRIQFELNELPCPDENKQVANVNNPWYYKYQYWIHLLPVFRMLRAVSGYPWAVPEYPWAIDELKEQNKEFVRTLNTTK